MLRDSEGKRIEATYLGRVYTPIAAGGWLDIPKGALTVNSLGRISYVGERDTALKLFPNNTLYDYSQFLITPGFVDCHQHLCHYDWVRLIPDLMTWLKRIYELEVRFSDLDYARAVSRRFFLSLMRNGTTTACVHGPYFAHATDIAFQVATEVGVRVTMGMNMADMNVPSSLYAMASTSVKEASFLYDKWHNKIDGLLTYCFTVRPAYCASEELMRCVSLAAAHLGARLQCHLAEDDEGQKAIVRLFPACETDTEVYDMMGLLGPRTIMAHGVYLSDRDRSLLAKSGTSIAHCPRANLMAGGKQFNLQCARNYNLTLGLGTDLGGAKGLSMFKNMEDAIKVSPSISSHDVYRMGTLDGARVLGISDVAGSLESGKEADFLILAPKLLQHMPEVTIVDIEDLLSSLIFHGDDRDVKIVGVRGERINERAL